MCKCEEEQKARQQNECYLHELLLLLLPRADGISDGADLAEDGLRLLQLVARRAVGHLLVNPEGQSQTDNIKQRPGLSKCRL